MGVIQGNVIVRAHDGGGLEISTDGGATWATVSGGGSGFTSDVIIQQPNSASALVNTLELKNQFVSNTAGSETADWDVIVPVSGTQRTLKLGRANLGARQTATTVGATDSIAVNPRADLVVVTLGVDATSLTFTGLDLETDFEYEVSANPLVGATTGINLQLNGTSTGYSGRYTYNSSAQGTNAGGGNLTSFQLVDALDAAAIGSFRGIIRKVNGGVTSFDCLASTVSAAVRYVEIATAVSTFTTDVTSLVLSGTIKATSVIVLRRVRAVAV